MNITQWIKESCEHQNATAPEDFIGMTRAYEYVCSYFNSSQDWKFMATDVIILGKLINNFDGYFWYRALPVTFVDGGTAVSPTHINAQMETLIDAYNDERVTPEEFYQRFEEIHPFTDGNGRVGALLYNWMKGTLSDPIHPPQFKSLMTV